MSFGKGRSKSFAIHHCITGLTTLFPSASRMTKSCWLSLPSLLTLSCSHPQCCSPGHTFAMSLEVSKQHKKQCLYQGWLWSMQKVLLAAILKSNESVRCVRSWNNGRSLSKSVWDLSISSDPTDNKLTHSPDTFWKHRCKVGDIRKHLSNCLEHCRTLSACCVLECTQ